MGLGVSLDASKGIGDSFTAGDGFTLGFVGSALSLLSFADVLRVEFAIDGVDIGETLLLGLDPSRECGLEERGTKGELGALENGELGVNFSDCFVVADIFSILTTSVERSTLEGVGFVLKDTGALELLLDLGFSKLMIDKIVDIVDFRTQKLLGWKGNVFSSKFFLVTLKFRLFEVRLTHREESYP